MADEQQDTAIKTSHPSTKHGEESFSEEIKDYAKTTMNELLGMFGYDDEITSESVNNLEIKVPSTSEESSRANTVSNSVATVAMATMSNANASSIPVNIPDDSSDDVPVIVKVEGNTSVSDIIRKQNGQTSTASVETTVQVTLTDQTNVTTSQPQPVQSTPMNITMTTESQSGQPSLAPHFYAVPPAVRGVYCVVANLPLAVNQNKSAMTFKFWNCITCSEYFLEKPEIVFRVHYPHLFTGQPEWLYQAAVCLKCYHHLITTVNPQTTTIPTSLSQATFTVIDCNKEGRGEDTGSVYTTANIYTKEVVTGSIIDRKSPDMHGNISLNNGNPPEKEGNPHLLNASKDKDSLVYNVSNGSDYYTKDMNGNSKETPPSNSQISLICSVDNPAPQSLKKTCMSVDSLKLNLPSQQMLGSVDSSKLNPPPQETFLSASSSKERHNSRENSISGSPVSPKLGQETKHGSQGIETVEDCEESYKCYVCNLSVSITSLQGKLRRSKFPSLFTNVADNVGHFKVCQGCCDDLHHQRDLFIKTNIPDTKRDYSSSFRQSTLKSPNACFVCEATFNEKEPSRPIYRSRYPSLFRGLPGHTIYIPLCDKCYKKLQKIKLRFDSNELNEEARNYVEFVNMWRAKRGLGKHPVLI